MKYYEGYFKNKKITIMGLGLLGRGLGDAKFFAEEGADIIITDLKKEEDLSESLKELSKYKNIKYTLGEHKFEDFKNRDFILKSAGVPLDSPFIAEAKKNNIPIEMDASLFASLAGGAILIGITGTRGKTTTTMLIYEIISRVFEGGEKKVYLGGNIQGVATLPLIKKVKDGDIVVLELDSWQLQGFGDARLSPHIAVFTNFMNDHLNYYKGDLNAYFKDKVNIFLYQKKDDYLVAGSKATKEIISKFGSEIKGKFIQVGPSRLPEDWNIKIRGQHNKENISLAIKVANILNINEEITKNVVENFKGVPGRLQFEKNYFGIYFYNDTTATTPDATLAGLKTLSFNKNLILIMGGTDKSLDMSELISNLSIYVKAVVLLPGTGSDKIRDKIMKDTNIEMSVAADLKDAVEKSLSYAKKGDTILFSPAFASFGMFKNEYDRGDKFSEIVRSL